LAMIINYCVLRSVSVFSSFQTTFKLHKFVIASHNLFTCHYERKHFVKVFSFGVILKKKKKHNAQANTYFC
jgi:hypothetical protein